MGTASVVVQLLPQLLSMGTKIQAAGSACFSTTIAVALSVWPHPAMVRRTVIAIRNAPCGRTARRFVDIRTPELHKVMGAVFHCCR